MTLNCREGDLHVWTIDLAIDDAQCQDLLGVLSPEERKRAGKLIAERDRRRFIAARGGLRRILSRYAGIDAAAIVFDYGEFGKPSLRRGPGVERLDFNLSHAGDIALCATAEGCPVGIDVEEVRADVEVDRIAEQFFSPDERRAVADARDPADTFTRIWVRKEAYLKGIGRGLGVDLTRITVPVDSDLISVAEPDDAEAAWLVREVPVPPGYRAAVATRGALRLSMRRYIA
jgi:4'-phosphopantetheinyl transferase